MGGGGKRTGPRPRETLAVLARKLGEISVAAGRDILQIRAGALQIRTKPDASFVTDADERAEAIILEALAGLCPGIPVIAEEAVASGVRPAAGRAFLLVDPLDGTREFVGGLDEFTVNIALVRDGAPVAGAVYAPAAGRLWYGSSASGEASQAQTCRILEPAGAAAFGEPVPVSTRIFVPATATALISRSFTDAQANAFIAAAGVRTLRKAGSSLKFCLIAAGEADIYPRFGAINEWDIAAGDAVLRAAGGIVAQTNGLPVVYGNPAFSTPPFIAFGDRIAAARLTTPKDV